MHRIIPSSIQKYFLMPSLLFVAACGNEKGAPPPPPPPQITVQEAMATDAVYYDEYPASIAPLNQVELRPQVSGFITGVHFTDGSKVTKGQLLYTIDDQLYASNYQQAMANVKVQEANLNRAQKDAGRYHELDKHDAVAKQLVDNADAALEVARRQAEAARATMKGVQTNLRYTKVFAPFTGTIGISLVKVGTSVTAGQTLLNTVSTDNVLAVDFSIDQKELFRFSKLLADKSHGNDSTFTLAFAGEVYEHPGKLALIDRAVNAQTGTIRVRATFPNNENLLRPGMNGTVRVKNSASKQSVVIPYKAVTEQLGEFFVYLPGDSNKVTQRKVVLGEPIGADIIVKEGLKPGEKIAVLGVQKLREGTVVQVVDSNQMATKK